MSIRNDVYSATHPQTLVVRHLQEREKEWADLVNKAGPLQLLNLPLDILQTILKEITHTNDLTALALTHSILHKLVIPHIYSRFDIVWPDAGPTIESRVNVDALTYGLATLVMAQDVFGEGAYHQMKRICTKCGSVNFCQHQSAPARSQKIRRGNQFAQFTRKFSLENGPEDWVKEYLITKEGGKMLGTLVALAIGRMRNLESFTWDMPTGVLRDVWLALASLEGREDGQQCRLERVWVRWHDNQDTALPSISSGPATSNLPHLIPSLGQPSFQIPPYPRVEFPTFSVLPPLRSLSVLDLDELSYAEEMSVLIERSLSELRELRVGLARHAQNRPWARPLEDRTGVPPPLMQSGERASRPGGLLGVLVSRFRPMSNDALSHSNTVDTHPPDPQQRAPTTVTITNNETKSLGVESEHLEGDIDEIGNLMAVQSLTDPILQGVTLDHTHGKYNDSTVPTAPALPELASPGLDETGKFDQASLRLDVLELERIHLPTSILSQAFDWSRLHTLTILGCRDHEQLWKALRKRFTPRSNPRLSDSFRRNTSNELASYPGLLFDNTLSFSDKDYNLNIRRIHTDAVSPSLLAFLKDTLAPDTLEYLFLQQSFTYKSSVTIDQIYKHAVRRHRASLKKLLIDSNSRAADGSLDGSVNWKKWAINRELITCITSGRMCLRELSISIDYKDWHYFLQRLPNAFNLRSLHISHIAGYVHNRIDAREVALQVLDIVALRPELELCYLGIQSRCFEIVEYPSNEKVPLAPLEIADVIASSHTVDDDDDDDVSDDYDDHDAVGSTNDSDDLNLVTDEDDEDNEKGAEHQNAKNALRLREILFYDDKISIFKARHGRL